MSEFKRQHPIAAVTRVIESIKQNFITIVILLFIGTSNTEGYFIYFLLGGIAITLVSGVLSWVVFRYRVHEDELQIKKGVLVKSNMYLSKDRIQVIDITEGLLQRMFGLVKVEVKTAGGGTETATISAISRGDAEALRSELRKKRSANGEGEEEAEEVYEEEEEVQGRWQLSTKDLVFAAFTSGNFGLIASILGAVSGQMDEFINEETIEYVYEALPGYSDVTLIVGIVIAIIVISWALSFLGVIFKYSDFQLEKTSKELIITSGLVERKHITVPFDRIQAVRFVEGVIRQPFGYGMLYVESAGFDQTQKGRSIVLVPFIASSNISNFLAEFLEEYKEPEYQIRPPGNTLWRYIRRPNYFVLPLIPIAWYLMEYGWLSLLIIPLLGYLGWMRYQDAALGLGDKILRMRYRVVSRTTAIVKKNRIQNAETSQNPFQENKDIQNLTVTAASGAGGMGFETADLSSRDTLKVLKWLMNEPIEEEETEVSYPAQTE
ncbi:PH domain-containing protein [Gracilimonas sp.]|nr:PH domain-containing protein [Gracilimonas sp.]